MISLEVRVNGSLVATVNCINRRVTGKNHLTRGPECEYEWTSAEMPWSMSGPASSYSGTLKHYRGDGAIALMRAICAAVIKSARDSTKKTTRE